MTDVEFGRKLSIHPRHWPGTGNGEKKNTRKQRDKEVLMRKIDAVQKHLERHPTEKHARSHLEKLMKML